MREMNGLNLPDKIPEYDVHIGMRFKCFVLYPAFKSAYMLLLNNIRLDNPSPA